MRLYTDSRISQGIYSGSFEWREQRFLNRFLRTGDVFVDVGANVGLFTLIAARRIGRSGHVYAFEPCSKTYQRLLTNVALNRLAQVSSYRLALSDRAAQLNINISLNGYDAWSSLAEPVLGDSYAVERVSAVTWDDFARENDLLGRVTMIKIDVEGWESRVLRGGTQALSRADAPVLQVEFTGQAARSAGSSCTELYRLLEELGYRMFTYDALSKRLIPDPLRERYPYLNLVAAKRPERVAARLEGRSR